MLTARGRPASISDATPGWPRSPHAASSWSTKLAEARAQIEQARADSARLQAEGRAAGERAEEARARVATSETARAGAEPARQDAEKANVRLQAQLEQVQARLAELTDARTAAETARQVAETTATRLQAQLEQAQNRAAELLEERRQLTDALTGTTTNTEPAKQNRATAKATKSTPPTGTPRRRAGSKTRPSPNSRNPIISLM